MFLSCVLPFVSCLSIGVDTYAHTYIQVSFSFAVYIYIHLYIYIGDQNGLPRRYIETHRCEVIASWANMFCGERELESISLVIRVYLGTSATLYIPIYGVSEFSLIRENDRSKVA